MSKRLDRKFADTNSLVMGHGVGLATLEAMFNMVNTQSLLSANMVRDFEMAHPLQMQSLARALTQILATGEQGYCRGYGGYDAPVAVDFPRKGGGGAKAGGETEVGAVPNLDAIKSLLNEKNTETEVGAVPNLDAIKDLLNEKITSPAGGDTTTSNLSLKSTQTGLDGADVDKHISELMELLRGHLSDIVEASKEASKPTLAVT